MNRTVNAFTEEMQRCEQLIRLSEQSINELGVSKETLTPGL